MRKNAALGRCQQQAGASGHQRCDCKRGDATDYSAAPAPRFEQLVDDARATSRRADEQMRVARVVIESEPIRTCERMIG
jgi:hypothetical protein